MTPLTLARPQESALPRPFNLQLAQRTLAELSLCSSNLKDLTESILLAVSRKTSPSSSNKEAG